MSRTVVYYNRYPDLADTLKKHADPDSPTDAAYMDKAVWLEIKKDQYMVKLKNQPNKIEFKSINKQKPCNCKNKKVRI